MDTTTPKFKVRLGVFIIGGVALFLLALFILGKSKNLFNPVFKLTTDFQNISGLEVGCNIRFAGITVGTVDNLYFLNDSTVKVDLLVNKSVQQFIKEDCQATISSEGIIGDRILVITQGGYNSKMAKEGQHIDSKEPIETDAIMASLQKTAGSVEIISAQLAEIMIKVNSGQGTLGRLINDATIAQELSETTVNLKNSSQQISEILVDINSGHGTLGKVIRDSIVANDLTQTMLNLKYSSRSINELLEAAKHNILFRGYFKNKEKGDEKGDEKEKSSGIYRPNDQKNQQREDDYTVRDIQQLASGMPIEMDTLMTNLNVTAANSVIISNQLANIMVTINSGKGTLGMLLKDTVLANVINQTLLNMKSSSKGLDENMKAAKENFLFKGYFERKKKNAELLKKEKEQKK